MEAYDMRRAVIVIICVGLAIALLSAVSLFYFAPEPERELEPEQVQETIDIERAHGIRSEDISIKREGKSDLRATLMRPYTRESMEEKMPLIAIVGDWYLFGGSTHEYSEWAKFFAENGYMSLLIELENFSDPFLPQTDIWAEDLEDAVEWAEGNLTLDGIAIFAHGLGATAAMRYGSSSDTLKAMVVLSGGSLGCIEELKVPLQIFTGDFDIFSYAALLFSVPLYRAAQNPKEIISINAGTHWGMSDFIDAFMPEPNWEKSVIEHYSHAWFDYFLKNDTSAYKAITEPYTGLSPVMPSLYDLGSGEQKIAGGRLFFEDPMNNAQRAFRSAPEALKPLTRNVLDVCTNTDYIIASLPGFIKHITEFFIAWVKALTTSLGDML
jgi:dienelactone hydrolase